MPELCELYPLGGAADRLHLQDPETKAELPAAKLKVLGKTLLELLIADLQAREYLHYKIFGKEVITPIAMMTSLEKNNYDHILSICEKNQWFGRPKESIRIFLQPLVPTITDQGKWCMKESLQLLLKPSGHGAIWKLARDYGVLNWFKDQKRKKALVRQINNPIAGIDYGLLAFTGLGCSGDKHFGFASCPRECGSAEGVNILIEKKLDEGYEYKLSNIEYCDFERYGINDEPRKEGDKYSKFSSNTNILFADLAAIESAVQKRPFPGVLINLKDIKFKSGKKLKEKRIARLESTMQNIADEFIESYPEPLLEEQRALAKTFITYNHRHKTISTAKKVYFPGKSTMETPERFFYDYLQNARALLDACAMVLPQMQTLDEYLEKGPNFIFRYHPALGPLYSIIKQKIIKGKMRSSSELVCDIAELFLNNLDLQGSLLILADSITGHKDERGLLHPSHFGGKCFLSNVRVENLGMSENREGRFWTGDAPRRESLTIRISGNGEFHAENVTLKGSYNFDVPSGYSLRVFERDGKIEQEKTKISSSTWCWKYEISEDFQVKLLRSTL
jgi:UTP---glucose-1-phosphate uridylyltransferase